MRLEKRGRTYHAVWFVYDAANNRKEVSRSTHTGNRRVAEERARQFESDLSTQEKLAGEEVTLGELFDDFREIKARLVKDGVLSPSTLDAYDDMFLALLKRLGGRRTLAREITNKRVDAYVLDRKGETVKRYGNTLCVSDSTVARELKTLKQILRLAQRNGKWSGGDWTTLVPQELVIRYKPRTRYLSDMAEFDILWSAIGSCPSKGIVPFILATSARISEARKFSLKNGDLFALSRRNRMPVVISSIVDWDEKSNHPDYLIFCKINGTKTNGSKRIVPIVLPWQKTFMRLVLEEKENISLWEKDGHINSMLVKACVKTGLERISPNDLRRTTASWLVQQQVATSIVAKVLGHTTEQMVSYVYGKSTYLSIADGMMRGLAAGAMLP